MSDHEYRLDSMVCFAVYSASNAIAKAHRVALAPWGLTYTQYIALLELSTSPTGLTVSELSDRMGLDSGTLSPVLRRLDQRGLAFRARTSSDERVVTVSLTDEGTSVINEVVVALQELRGAYGFDSPEQAHELVQQLHRITAGMRSLATSRRS